MVATKRYLIEDVFKDFDEYQHYFEKSLDLFRSSKQKTHSTLKQYVPDLLEIEFKSSIKAPRVYFPQHKGSLVIQLPLSKHNERNKKVLREEALKKYATLVKSNEIAIAEEFAIRMKILSRSEKK